MRVSESPQKKEEVSEALKEHNDAVDKSLLLQGMCLTACEHSSC